MRPDTVMIFAAGFGTRMGALTRDRPKPLIEVAGKPLIDHARELAAEAGIARVVVNAHYHADQVVAHLDGTGAEVTVETPDILDTGGGLRAALPLTGPGPLFTLNSDAVWAGPSPLGLLHDAWVPGRMEALLLCVSPDRAVGHAGAGDFTIAPDGTAVRGPGHVFTGAQIVTTDMLDAIDAPAFSLNLIWDRMIARGTLHALDYPGRWCDVGHPAGITLAEELLGAADV